MSRTAPAPRYHSERPTDLRRSTPWHRLSYIVDELPRRLAGLATDLRVTPASTILDFGCADTPYRHLFPADATYLAADLPGNPAASVTISPEGTVPVADGSVDAVLSTQVLEHVADPAVYLAECARVLRPGGRLLLSTHGLMVYHPDPVDYWRWTCAGLRRAVEDAGLRVVRFEGMMGLAASGLQFIQDAYYWRAPRRLRPLLALVAQTLIKIAERLERQSNRDLNALVFGLVAEKPWRRLALPRLVRAFADAYPEATFVEVGANDGAQHDRLRDYILTRRWRGVMVEPVPYVFARLQANYAGVERVALENAAIAERDGRRSFFHLRDASEDERAELPDWYDGVGSFNRAAILSHAPQMPDIAERIVERKVEALSLATLCARHGIETLDLLAVDAEGYDWEIIRSIDFSVHTPRLLVYEHFHLSPADRAACQEHLRGAGYEVMEEGFDTLALRAAPEDALTRVWRGLEPGVAGVSKADEETGA